MRRGEMGAGTVLVCLRSSFGLAGLADGFQKSLLSQQMSSCLFPKRSSSLVSQIIPYRDTSPKKSSRPLLLEVPSPPCRPQDETSPLWPTAGLGSTRSVPQGERSPRLGNKILAVKKKY